MVSKSLKQISLLTAATISQVVASDAPYITNNPTDVVYRADFPSGFSQNVVGVIQFYSNNGTTKVHVDITGLPKNAGIFHYHIHENAVPEDGNCESTGKHFNPFGASSDDCDSWNNDAKCQVGDLSGKHGYINTTCFETYYYDPYISLDPSHPSFIGGKSINIHLESMEKLACTNIYQSTGEDDLLLLDVDREAQQVASYYEAFGLTARDESSAGVSDETPQETDIADSGLSDSETGSEEDSFKYTSVGMTTSATAQMDAPCEESTSIATGGANGFHTENFLYHVVTAMAFVTGFFI